MVKHRRAVFSPGSVEVATLILSLPSGLFMRLVRRMLLCLIWAAAVGFSFRAWLPFDIDLSHSNEPGVELLLSVEDSAGHWHQKFGRRLRSSSLQRQLRDELAARRFSGQVVVFGAWSAPVIEAVRAALGKCTDRAAPLLIVPTANQDELLQWGEPGEVGYQSIVVLVCNDGRVESVSIRDAHNLSFDVP